ncbi:TERF2IP [Cervus elaphus hippelaphus]|uniref:Telomeric repeat-binding factor 2-interacting protein 1 n=1 Tax=Cervus elaphus hippelaphus TaxID=46360 RepID=A0A212DDB4_CEREH|nr:TERF2IP [Cervus elaphus hippelaphus]
MAEAMDLGKDPNGPTHSSTLFVREDGSSMSFYVRPSPAKRRLSTLILHGGGTLCRVQEPGAVLLAQPGEAAAEASGDFISTQYILDCVERNEKLELEAYRLGPAPAADQAPETKPGVQAGGAVDESPDFEIHITMCDDDPPTPEEDSETQPDEEEEEEEEKVSAPEVGAAIKIIRQLMEKFNLDLSTVTQAFLKNSGELEATSSFLESGQRADGYPIWSRQDDLDLQKDDEATRDALVKKFGAQNVARRIEFRKK